MLPPFLQKKKKAKKKRKRDKRELKPRLALTHSFSACFFCPSGVEIWRLEKMTPVPLPADLYGKFANEDCYIVLKTEVRGESGAFYWNIHYWIGKNTQIVNFLDSIPCFPLTDFFPLQITGQIFFGSYSMCPVE
jgi:hypothetical protein